VCTTVHELAVQLQPGSVCVSSAALEPATLDIQDLVAECRQQQAAGQQLPTLVSSRGGGGRGGHYVMACDGPCTC
jgi:hypothetical protein